MDALLSVIHNIYIYIYMKDNMRFVQLTCVQTIDDNYGV